MKLINHIRKYIEPGTSMLDIGCGPGNYSKKPFKSTCTKIVTIDAWEKVNPDIVADLEKESVYDLVQGEQFDYIMMIDFVEHLDREHGERIISEAKRLCKKKIFLLTPLEPIWNDNSHNVNDPKLWCYGNHYDYHKSMWDVSDFPNDDGWTREIPCPIFKDYYYGYWENNE